MRNGEWVTPPRGYAYDPTANSWTALPISPLRGRVGHAGVWTGSQMLVWGGEPVAGASPDDPAFVDGATCTP